VIQSVICDAIVASALLPTPGADDGSSHGQLGFFRVATPEPPTLAPVHKDFYVTVVTVIPALWPTGRLATPGQRAGPSGLGRGGVRYDVNTSSDAAIFQQESL
jgi:hypothetical protein